MQFKATVKWFNDNKGYGFLDVPGFVSNSGSTEVFVHYTAIYKDGYKSLVEGETVTVELVDGPKGAQAAKVFKSGAA